MSEGVHARVAVEPNDGCPLECVGDEHAVTRLVPARGDDATPQVMVRADADDLADVASVEPVVETERRVVCRLTGDHDCGDRCLARGFEFLPVQPYAVRWGDDRLRLQIAAADRDEVRDTVTAFHDAGFAAELVSAATADASDPATLAVLDLTVLTERQREAARVAVEHRYFDADGADADEVAAELGISKATLSDHLRAVRAELGEQAFPPRT